jgi:hypothetical protein
MFTPSIILTNHFASNPNPATLQPGAFKQFIANANPNWIDHFKSKMLSLGFSPEHWDAADWEPTMWSHDNAMHSKNPTSCALLAIGGYLFRSAVQITRHRPFVDTPITSEQLTTIHPSIQSESVMLISFSQKMWQEKQAGYFVVAEQEKENGLWPHDAAFYVDTPYAVMLMCKYNAMQQAKQNGNMQRFEELLHYPRKKAPKVGSVNTVEKVKTQELYQQWLSHCAELKAKKVEIERQILEHREAIKSLQEQYEQIKAPRFK